MIRNHLVQTFAVLTEAVIALPSRSLMMRNITTGLTVVVSVIDAITNRLVDFVDGIIRVNFHSQTAFLFGLPCRR
jgi:hypothetical protein